MNGETVMNKELDEAYESILIDRVPVSWLKVAYFC